MRAPFDMRSSAAIRALLIGLVVAYGALLRFDALTLTYGPVERPAWLRALQQTRTADSTLRPDSFQWARWEGRYISDPYTYLRYAREMTSFYAAHRREPVFPAATKVSLWLLHDHDTAVSFASGVFSVAAILATFLLGYAAFGYWIGLGAAAAMAIEYEVVTWGIGGWRDDAFTCAVLVTSWAMVRYAQTPSARRAAIFGVLAGLAVLVRITALSFIVPGALWLLVTVATVPWRTRTKHLGAAALLGLLVAGPYLVNCWRTFGDPLYAINVHADVYREAEGKQAAQQSAGGYVRDMVASRPWEAIDTALLGMTAYPFENKWRGFDHWWPVLSRVLKLLALVGAFLLLGAPEGRLLLVVLAGSLVPYALTWRLIGDWRFTLHAYPFFLIAASLTIGTLWRVAAVREWRTRAARIPRSAVLLWSAALMIVAVVAYGATSLLPVLVAREQFAAGTPVSVVAGPRDRAFFVDGWSGYRTDGNVTSRTSTGDFPAIVLPLTQDLGYRATIRVDPSPPPDATPVRPLPVLRIFLNGQVVHAAPMQWDPHRVGAYVFDIPARLVDGRRSRLTLSATYPDGTGARLRVWYVRLTPTTRTDIPESD